jgi:predicted protein tyrosine phosphatase
VITLTKYRKIKRPRKLLRAYALFLNGLPEIEIIRKDITEAELLKIKQFHEQISESRVYTRVCYELGIDSTLGKRMIALYYENQEGKELSYPPHRVSFKNAFKMLLDDAKYEDMIEQGCSELQIENAKKFLQFIPHSDGVLLHTLGQKFGIGRESAAAMLRLYRDKQAEIQQKEMKRAERNYKVNN